MPATPAANAACSSLRRSKYTDSEVISEGRTVALSPGRGRRISIGFLATGGAGL
jgi:hypothetical protein